MTNIDHHPLLPAARRRAGLIASGLAACAILLSSCGDRTTTGAIPDDYRTRHPIVIAEGPTTLDLPVASGDTHLTTGMKDTIRGFGQSFSASGAGVMQVQVPHGSYNAGAASVIGGQVRRTLTAAGIPARSILMTGYAASPNGDAAPIRLSFVATKAMTDQCGQWPDDLSDNTFGNKNWYNFGCASQNNLAAQIANPSDLIGPRAMTPIDATQRAGVIAGYRGETSSGSTTTTTTTTSN